MSHLFELSAKLKEIFQIDRADLDFGIYRILNTRRQEIERYLSETLPQAVKQAFGENQSEQVLSWKNELEQAKKQAQDLGIDPTQSPKVQDLQNKIAQARKSTGDNETAVYRHLLTFFGRYYEDGDFISQRRYKGDTYAVPYAGEEVLLHWANKDQYYTKSGENFSNYRFTLKDGREVLFRIYHADTAKDNQKDNKAKRFFVLAEDDTIEQEDENGDIFLEDIQAISEIDNGKTLQIRFNYIVSNDGKQTPIDKERGTEKDTSFNTQSLNRIFANETVVEKWQELATTLPTENNAKRTLLEKHLNIYTQKNTADYFIHKDLGGFLRRELDFYIKNEVMNLDDVQSAQSFAHIEANLRLIQTLRSIALEIIGFLAQLENFQKKLWLKKKFVANCHYLITLNHIPTQFYQTIFANTKQREQWENLFSVKDLHDHDKDLDFSNASNPYAYLVVDTSLFPAEFQSKLLTALSAQLSDSLDDHINGTLIHSDNFQALNLLQARYREQVKCIYIDPPYNTEDDRAKGKFVYKDGYPSSTWASLIHSRLILAKPLLNQLGLIFQSIDDNEHSRLKILSDDIFGCKNYLSSFVRKTKSMTGDDSNGLNIQHEYLVSYSANKNVLKMFGEKKTLKGYSNPDNDPNGDWCSGDPSAKSGGDSTYFSIKNPYTGKEDYPPKGRFWAFSQKTMKEYINNGRIKFKETHEPTQRGFIFKRYAEKLTSNFNPVGTLFSSENHYMNSVATIEINHLLNGLGDFDYPKPKIFIEKLIQYSTNSTDLILDYFAGSGTTAHAVINLNRQDKGNRQYILVEQGEYFDTVLKPRVKKVIYSQEWKDGKPVASDKHSSSLNGVPQIVKVLKLESYEDTLNNLVLQKQQAQLPTEEAQKDYLLHYMLNIESRDSLLNVSHFAKPFDYGLNISTTSAGAYAWQKVDLVETFNYLIGVKVIGVDDKRTEQGFVAVECRLPNQHSDDKTLIFWRDCHRIGYEELQKHFNRLGINPADSEYSQVYVNGDHTLETVWDGEYSGSLKIRSIEAEFLALMFAGEE